MPFTVKVKKNKGFNSYDVNLKDITSGKVVALIEALKKYDSYVGNDILIQLEREVQKVDILN